MSNYLTRSLTSDSETRDQAFRRMREHGATTADFASEKPRHRRVAYITAIQSGTISKGQAVALEERQQKPSELVLAVIQRLQDD